MLKKDDGWSFMETLIVISIVLILTTSVGFMGMKSLEKARRASVISQIDSLCIALEAFYIDTGSYPTKEQGLSALRIKPQVEPISTFWNGPYLYKEVPKDSWGNAFEYIVPGKDGSPYGILSFGADGKEGGEDDITSW